jgi:hypothetical protein
MPDWHFKLGRCRTGRAFGSIEVRDARDERGFEVTIWHLKGERRPAISPYAFTEQGVAMLSSVLRSPRAVEVNIAIMRTFVQLRRLMDSNRELARRIEAMEEKYDEQFAVVFDAIKKLIAEDDARKARPKRPIGFIS